MLQRLFNNDYDWFGNNMFNNMRMNNVPPVNIAETKDGFTIEMAAPGYSKKDFMVNVDKNLLTITVDKHECHGKPGCAPEKEAAASEATSETSETETQEPANNERCGKKIYRREFRYGSFSRSFTLPEGVDGQKISGAYTDGILTLNIPRAEVVNTRMSVEIR